MKFEQSKLTALRTIQKQS